MPESKKHSLNCDGHSDASRETPELFLQIATKNKFFAEPRRDCQRGLLKI